jgi:3-hydroxy-9,10-secoandrosta-1,3,5(10)-triene-9,17-dione monooxygenase reductase component
MEGGGGYVHYEDPFATPHEQRDPARRLRGRLVAPVTLWTSRSSRPVGLTVSSAIISEGDPSTVLGLVTDTTDLYEAIVDTSRFVVHVLEHEHRALAESFAGVRPSPGGAFAGLDVTDTEWGPAIAAVKNRAYCKLIDDRDGGYQRLIRAEIERIDVAELDRPLVYFRGRFKKLD